MIVTRKDVEQLAIEAINDAYPGQAHQMQSLIKSITNKFFHHVYNSEMTDEDMENILDEAISVLREERSRSAKRYRLVPIKDDSDNS
jgi:hypothetical protein|tara:strand:- start:3839 stop:4099 length:261 start_codon:yes stop_codon:yes gene_type:complete